MERDDLNEIFERYSRNTATEQDMKLLFDYFQTSDEGTLRALIRDALTVEEPADPKHEQKLQLLYQQIQQKIKPAKTNNLWPLILTAATLLLFVAIGVYVINRPAVPNQHVAQQTKQDIAPGGNKAILTLSNGQQIVLNGKTGLIASQAGRAVNITSNGQVTYSGQAKQSNNKSKETIYNTLTVPIGNTRDITLPDGTQVSLDAGSSITYPVAFEKERRVAMTGQAYFNVKHDPEHPFYTTVKGVTIADIGTEFNINAYDDEQSIKTTLIQGSVKVNERTIKPGEQAQTKDNSTSVKTVDTDVVTAWKNNDFYFDNETLKSSMRQIARWYNVKVVYGNVDEELKLFVDVTRATNLSVVLKAIENTGKVKCRLEGNTITLSQPK